MERDEIECVRLLQEAGAVAMRLREAASTAEGARAYAVAKTHADTAVLWARKALETGATS